MTKLDFYNHFDCQTSIGNKSFVFFSPVEIGGFVAQVWTSHCRLSGTGEVDPDAPGARFSMSLYGPNGASTLKDERLSHFRWRKLLQKSWQDDILSKSEVEEILVDLHRVQRIDDEFY